MSASIVSPIDRPHVCTAHPWKKRWATTEHVVFAYELDHTPSITYHSIPHGCTGGADTLTGARKAYRSEMAALHGVNCHELPPVIEHLEVGVSEMWVRTKIGAVHRDAAGDRMFLQTLLLDGPAQDALRMDLERTASRTGRPVVVIVEPDEPMEAVLDQMTAQDVLLVVHSDSQSTLVWVVVYGAHASGADDMAECVDQAHVRRIPVKDLTCAYDAGSSREVRLHQQQPC
jgi:hypothetical protein